MMTRGFRRHKTPLLVLSLLALFLAPLAVIGVNRVIDAQFQSDFSGAIQNSPVASSACQPVLKPTDFTQLSKVVVSENAEGQVSSRMAEIFTADQAGRLNPLPIGPQMSSEEDRLRRIEVLSYLRENKLQTARELVGAAYVFQHGDCAEHYRLANLLAELAMKTGCEDAKWIYAATLDRYLMTLGQPQKYGTQYRRVGDRYELYAIDPATTDEERRRYNVPDLATAEASTFAAGPMSSGPMVQILESWWLTVIGIGLSALSVALALLDSTRYSNLARRTLMTAAVVYVLSIVGHFSQVSALARNSAQPDNQSTLWLVSVMLAGLVLAIQVVTAITRWLKRS